MVRNIFDEILDNIIREEIPSDKVELTRWMSELTKFVDGVYVRAKTYVEYALPNELTSLEVVSFPFTHLESALALSYAVGVDNSLLLLQQYQVIPQRVEFGDTKSQLAELKDFDPPESQPNAFLCVFRDKNEYTPYELLNRLKKPDYGLVCDKQNRVVDRFRDVIESWSTDFEMLRNRALSAAFEYKFNEARRLMPLETYRRDVIWSERFEEDLS